MDEHGTMYVYMCVWVAYAWHQVISMQYPRNHIAVLQL